MWSVHIRPKFSPQSVNTNAFLSDFSRRGKPHWIAVFEPQCRGRGWYCGELSQISAISIKSLSIQLLINLSNQLKPDRQCQSQPRSHQKKEILKEVDRSGDLLASLLEIKIWIWLCPTLSVRFLVGVNWNLFIRSWESDAIFKKLVPLRLLLTRHKNLFLSVISLDKCPFSP